MYVYTYTYLCVYIYTCITLHASHIRKHIYIYTVTCIYIYVYIYIYIYVYTYIYTYMYMYTHNASHVRYTYIHVHIWLYIVAHNKWLQDLRALAPWKKRRFLGLFSYVWVSIDMLQATHASQFAAGPHRNRFRKQRRKKRRHVDLGVYRRRRSELKYVRLPKYPTSFLGSPHTYQTRFLGSPQNSKQVFILVNRVPVTRKIYQENW